MTYDAQVAEEEWRKDVVHGVAAIVTPDAVVFVEAKHFGPQAEMQAVWEKTADSILSDRLIAREAIAAIREHGKCGICYGTGKPQHNCADGQTCRCGPNGGINLDRCWHCSGSGLRKWASDALSRIAVQKGTEA